MNVNLQLKFEFNDNHFKDENNQKVDEFMKTTCINKYLNTTTSILHDGLMYNYYANSYTYENVPLDRMHELYSDVQKYDGKISIIINEFVSSR
jgi:hypothetical protein